MVASYNTKFGLDKPVMQQYFDYIGSLARGDLGVEHQRIEALPRQRGHERSARAPTRSHGPIAAPERQ